MMLFRQMPSLYTTMDLLYVAVPIRLIYDCPKNSNGFHWNFNHVYFCLLDFDLTDQEKNKSNSSSLISFFLQKKFELKLFINISPSNWVCFIPKHLYYHKTSGISFKKLTNIHFISNLFLLLATLSLIR